MASLALGAIAFGQSKVDDHVIEQSFPEGGLVTMNLSSGDYAVRAGATGRIRVRWHAEDARHERGHGEDQGAHGPVRKRRDDQDAGTDQSRAFHDRDSCTVGLHLRIRAGDVRIEGIEGNKDVRMTAGDLDIDVAPDSLRHVHASVSIGDLKARALGIDKDGFKNSLDWFGDGAYTLDARMFAGDMKLRMAGLNEPLRRYHEINPARSCVAVRCRFGVNCGECIGHHVWLAAKLRCLDSSRFVERTTVWQCFVVSRLIEPRRDSSLRGLLERVGDLDQPRLAAGAGGEGDAERRRLGVESGGHPGAFGTVPKGTMTVG